MQVPYFPEADECIRGRLCTLLFMLAFLAIMCVVAYGCANAIRDSSYVWEAVRDDSLDCLTTQVAGGRIVAMPGNGWAPRDGFIQLQLGDSSIGGKRIEAVYTEGDCLVVVMGGFASASGEATTDLTLSEYRLTGKLAAETVSDVVLKYHGTHQTVERAFG